MNKLTITILLSITFFNFSQSIVGQAVIPQPKIVYTKGEYGHDELVVLTSDTRQSFDAKSFDCRSLSPDASFIALSNRDNQILIHSVLDGTLVKSIIPINNQSGCNFRWEADGTLGLFDSTQPPSRDAIRTVNIMTGEILPSTPIRSSTPSQGSIPNLLSDDFYMISPNGNFVVYNYCPNSDASEAIFTGDMVCNSDGEIRLYDLNKQEVIKQFEDTDQGLYILFEEKNLAYAHIGVSWSPSSRYFLYRSDAGSQIHIYDVFKRQFLPKIMVESIQIPLYIDVFQGFVWLEDQKQVVFWISNYEESGSRVATLELVSGSVSISTTQYEVSNGSIRWAQGIRDRTIVFITPTQELVELNLDTGATVILDTNVFSVEYR